jgi:hypothetical protein
MMVRTCCDLELTVLLGWTWVFLFQEHGHESFS